MNSRAAAQAFLVPLATIAGLFFCPVAGASHPARFEGVSRVEPVCVPTHIGFFGSITTVTLKPRGILYREGNGPWRKLALDLDGPHSIARLPDGRWLVNDTDHNRMIEFESLVAPREMVVRTELGGFPLNRPHDQIVDPEKGEVFVIDGNRRLFRFKSLAAPVDIWEFTPEQLGYDRALSWFDDRLHVVNSSRGEVLRIEDFDARRFTAFRSPRPKHPRAKPFSEYGDFAAGALETTGLVLNDVEKADGWYYGSNFFTPELAFGGDTKPGRLIRWRTWQDFEQGKWQDLSDRLPQGPVPLTPYFLSVHDHLLYTGVFDHDGPHFGPTDPKEPCKHDRLVEIDLRALK